MSIQFDTFDNEGDRRELVYLLEKLGADLPEQQAREARAEWLRSLIPSSVTRLAESPVEVDPAECYVTGAYLLFVAIVGVLGVPVRDAARRLDRYVSRRGWHETGDDSTPRR